MMRALALFAILLSVAAVSGVEKNAQSYNSAGYEFLSKGDPLKAVVQFRSALRQNGAYKESLLGMAHAYLALESYRDAFDYYSKVLKNDADNIDALTGIGFAYIGLGVYDRALEQFTDILKRSEENLDAHYGMAYIYYIMNKNLWAKRKMQTIFRLNPYHYKTLLLAAEIKSAENRFDEAEEFIKKALDERPNDPEGYIRYASLLNGMYIRKGDDGFLQEAIHNIKRALAIQPDNFRALNSLGYLYINERNFKGALDSFERARSVDSKNPVTSYNLGLSYEKDGDKAKALEYFESARKKNMEDELLLCRLENFLVSEEFKIGSPLRVNLSEYHFKTASYRAREHLNDEYLYHMRRSVFLNPLLRDARTALMRYNMDEGYDNLYIDELKNLVKLFPDGGYDEELNIAVMKRRNRVYHLAGFSLEEPERDVPNLMVLDFVSPGTMSLHPEAGEVIADTISFSLQQFGRMKSFDIPTRRSIMKKLSSRSYLPVDDAIVKLSDIAKSDNLEIDYVIYGEFSERGQAITYDYKLMDFKTGVIISEDSLYDRERDKLARLSLRTARKIYDKIPYKGRVLKSDDREIIVNMGLYDGLKSGDILYVNDEYDAGMKGKYSIKRKMLFKIDEADTIVSRATPVNTEDIRKIRDGVEVYPLMKRRAVRVK